MMNRPGRRTGVLTCSIRRNEPASCNARWRWHGPPRRRSTDGGPGLEPGHAAGRLRSRSGCTAGARRTSTCSDRCTGTGADGRARPGRACAGRCGSARGGGCFDPRRPHERGTEELRGDQVRCASASCVCQAAGQAQGQADQGRGTGQKCFGAGQGRVGCALGSRLPGQINSAQKTRPKRLSERLGDAAASAPTAPEWRTHLSRENT